MRKYKLLSLFGLFLSSCLTLTYAAQLAIQCDGPDASQKCTVSQLITQVSTAFNFVIVYILPVLALWFILSIIIKLLNSRGENAQVWQEAKNKLAVFTLGMIIIFGSFNILFYILDKTGADAAIKNLLQQLNPFRASIVEHYAYVLPIAYAEALPPPVGIVPGAAPTPSPSPTTPQPNNSSDADNSYINLFPAVKSPQDFLKILIDAALSVAIMFIVFKFVMAGFYFVTAQGNVDKLQKAKNTLLWTSVAVVLLALLQTFFDVLVNTIKLIA